MRLPKKKGNNVVPPFSSLQLNSRIIHFWVSGISAELEHLRESRTCSPNSLRHCISRASCTLSAALDTCLSSAPTPVFKHNGRRAECARACGRARVVLLDVRLTISNERQCSNSTFLSPLPFVQDGSVFTTLALSDPTTLCVEETASLSSIS